MARRPTSERILSRQELAEFVRDLMKLDRRGIEKMYEGSWRDCHVAVGGTVDTEAERMTAIVKFEKGGKCPAFERARFRRVAGWLFKKIY